MQTNWGDWGSLGVMKLWVAWSSEWHGRSFVDQWSSGNYAAEVFIRSWLHTLPRFLNVNTPPNSQNAKRYQVQRNTQVPVGKHNDKKSALILVHATISNHNSTPSTFTSKQQIDDDNNNNDIDKQMSISIAHGHVYMIGIDCWWEPVNKYDTLVALNALKLCIKWYREKKAYNGISSNIFPRIKWHHIFILEAVLIPITKFIHLSVSLG